MFNELPEVVYVQFDGCGQETDGAPGPSIYLVILKKKSWLLDQVWQYPQLELNARVNPCIVPKNEQAKRKSFLLM